MLLYLDSKLGVDRLGFASQPMWPTSITQRAAALFAMRAQAHQVWLTSYRDDEWGAKSAAETNSLLIHRAFSSGQCKAKQNQNNGQAEHHRNCPIVFKFPFPKKYVDVVLYVCFFQAVMDSTTAAPVQPALWWRLDVEEAEYDSDEEEAAVKEQARLLLLHQQQAAAAAAADEVMDPATAAAFASATIRHGGGSRMMRHNHDIEDCDYFFKSLTRFQTQHTFRGSSKYQPCCFSVCSKFLNLFSHSTFFFISSASSATISGDGGAMGDEVVDDEGYLGARRVQSCESQSVANHSYYLFIFTRRTHKTLFTESNISGDCLIFFWIQNQKCHTLCLCQPLIVIIFSRLSFYRARLHLPTSAHPLHPHLQSTPRGVCRVAPLAPRSVRRFARASLARCSPRYPHSQRRPARLRSRVR